MTPKKTIDIFKIVCKISGFFLPVLMFMAGISKDDAILNFTNWIPSFVGSPDSKLSYPELFILLVIIVALIFCFLYSFFSIIYFVFQWIRKKFIKNNSNEMPKVVSEPLKFIPLDEAIIRYYKIMKPIHEFLWKMRSTSKPSLVLSTDEDYAADDLLNLIREGTILIYGHNRYTGELERIPHTKIPLKRDISFMGVSYKWDYNCASLLAAGGEVLYTNVCLDSIEFEKLISRKSPASA